MAGQGPPPKPRNARARRNADRVAETVLRAEVVEPPELPARYREFPEVAFWWQTWVDSPQAEILTSTDWLVLLETLPLVHAYYYSVGADGLPNGLKYAAEIRLRVAAFGATPADRARLRMTFAAADEADRRRTSHSNESSRDLYPGLRIVNDK